MSESEVMKAGSVNSEALSPCPSKRKQPVEQKGEDEEPSASRENPSRSSQASPLRQANSRQSPEAKDSRRKGSGQSSGGSSCTRRHQGMGHLEEKRRGRPPPSRERGRDKAESSGAKQHRGRDSRHTRAHVKDRRPQPRSSTRPVKRRHPGDTCAAGPQESAKRSRHHSPEALSSRALSPLSRVLTCVGALEVGLEELQAPGGAFLHNVPSSSTEPTVSQRAWLTWQLAHAGAALHWALHMVDCILATQAWLPRYYS